MTKIAVRAFLLASAAIGVPLSAGEAAAQVATTAERQTAEEAFETGEIVVTARRRQENLQDVPVTLTAFSGEALQERGIDDFTRLIQATPGVNFDTFPRSAPRPFFRGIGSSNQGAGGDPSSVAFLDGVYLGRAAMLGIDFYDMERIEVLKGPQGTLWGKNVAAGAVNFITARPVDATEGTISLTFGDFGQRNVHAMYNTPLSDAWAVRLVGGAVKNDGFRTTADGRDRKSVV